MGNYKKIQKIMKKGLPWLFVIVAGILAGIIIVSDKELGVYVLPPDQEVSDQNLDQNQDSINNQYWGEKYGVIFHLGTASDYQKVLTLMDEAGINWIRVDILDSGELEFRNFLKAVRDYEEIHGNRFNILGIIDHITIGQRYENRNECYDSMTLDNWNDTVNYVLDNFASDIDAYEIWNEPTIEIFQFDYQDGSPEHYFEMLKSAYEKIKTKDPEAKVIGFGGLQIYAGGEDFVENDLIFARTLKDLGAENYLDAISLHAYPWGLFGKELWGYEDGKYLVNLNKYKKVWPDTEIWVTETGHYEEGLGSQSNHVKYSYTLFLNEGVKKIFWYQFIDDSADVFEELRHFGLVNNSLEIKLSYSALQDFISNYPQKGLLRVKTDPAMEARINVLDVDSALIGSYLWGIAWVKFDANVYRLEVYYPKDASLPLITINPLSIKSNVITEVTLDVSDGSYDLNCFWIESLWK